MAKRLTKNQLDELLKIAKSPKGKKRELKMSEDRHQAVIIRYLKMQYAKTKFSVNPFSGVEIKGMDAKAKSIFLKRMKLQGWESGVPDIILHASRFDFSSLAIELKTFDWYPFRPWRKTNDFFIEHTKDNKYKDHIIDQLMFLHGMREEKSLAMFVPGHENATRLIDMYMKEDHRLQGIYEPYTYEHQFKKYTIMRLTQDVPK